MVLFQTDGKVTESDNKTNINFSFEVPKGISELKISYEYSPKTLENEREAIDRVNACIEKFGDTEYTYEIFMPLKNLLTLSVDENGKYRGAAHRHPNKQQHVLSENYASPGFKAGKIEAGKWNIVLSVHNASCDVSYSIVVEGVAK